MPDIAMCNGHGCEKRERCYRHTATPTEHQTYFAAPPLRQGKCDYFWPKDSAAADADRADPNSF